MFQLKIRLCKGVFILKIGMVYKGKINGCTGFKMGKELKSMSVMIIIPMGIEKNGVVLSGVMGLRCMNVIGHQDGRRDILGRRAK